MGTTPKAILVLIGLVMFVLLAGNSTKKEEPNHTQCPPGWRCTDQGCYPVETVPVDNHPSDAELISSWETRYVGDSLPAVNLPYELRKSNWGGGSCVHATTISLLRWLAEGSGDPAMYEIAETWPHSGGEYSSRHKQRVEEANLRYCMTVDGDVELLRWAIATRRGAGIAYNGHCTALVGYDEATGNAIVLDNNHTDRYDTPPWDDLIARWQRGGGWAFAFVYDPPAPIPNVRQMARDVSPLSSEIPGTVLADMGLPTLGH